MKRLETGMRPFLAGLLVLFLSPVTHVRGGDADRVVPAGDGEAPVYRPGTPGFIDEWVFVTGLPDAYVLSPSSGTPPTSGYGIDYLRSIGGEGDARPGEGTVVEYDDRRYAFERISGRWLRRGRSMNIGLSSGGNAEYGFCYIESGEDTNAWLLVGSSWYCQVFLNGERLYPWHIERSKNDPEVFPVALRKGRNAFLVKSLQVDGNGNPRFQLLHAEEARLCVGRLFKPVLNIDIVKPFAPGKEKKGRWDGTLRVDFRQAATLCPDLEADVGILDTAGNERSNGSYIRWERVYPRVYESEGNLLFSSSEKLGQSFEVSLPDGIYRVSARLEDFYGRTILGETGIILDKDPGIYVERVLERAEKLRKRETFSMSAGWLLHLMEQVAKGLDGEGRPSGKACWWTHRLVYWLERLEEDPEDLLNQREWTEWAYESRVDGSGQPFLMQIPAGYDSGEAWPLHVWLHGSGQHHLGYRQDEKFGTDPEAFHLSVFARSRSGGYIGLSEVDPLEAIDFMISTWNIDPDRIHVYGYSMGGGGTYWIGSRFPDRFATLRPQAAGRVGGVPLDNLLHLPLYHIHSRDDSRAFFTAGQATVDKAVALGSIAVMDATDGEDHWIWNFEEGVERAREWADRNRRAGEVREIRYTALDEMARGAYWVRVEEWGGEGRPANVRVRMGNDNRLYAALENVRCLRVDLEASPAERGQPMSVFVGGTRVADIDAPLPRVIFLRLGEEGWTAGDRAPEEGERRLHFPGGIMALYHGEPLMIVWGTKGDAAMKERIARCADAARHACRPSWPRPEPWEMLPRYEMPFGVLPGKPDGEVTAADMETYNLILIGDADQNSLAARMMDRLPVQIRDGRVTASDGAEWSYEDRAAGLLYPNPFDERRLVYWIASSCPEFYEYGSPFFAEQTRMTAPPDFVLLDIERPRRVAARRFDSRWEWEAGYERSDPIPAEAVADGGASLVAGAVIRKTGSDFAMFSNRISVISGMLGREGSRPMDFRSWAYDQRLNVMTVSGERLSRLRERIAERGIDIQLYPAASQMPVEGDATYRVAMIDQAVSMYIVTMGEPPESFCLLDDYLYDALVLHPPFRVPPEPGRRE